jgi:hypothetical protein
LGEIKVDGTAGSANQFRYRIPRLPPKLCYAFTLDLRSSAVPATLREAIFPDIGVKCPESLDEIF